MEKLEIPENLSGHSGGLRNSRPGIIQFFSRVVFPVIADCRETGCANDHREMDGEQVLAVVRRLGHVIVTCRSNARNNRAKSISEQNPMHFTINGNVQCPISILS